MIYRSSPIRMAKIKNTDNTNAGEDVEEQDLSLIAGGNTKWYSHLTAWQFLTKLNILLTYCATSVILGIYLQELKTYP